MSDPSERGILFVDSEGPFIMSKKAFALYAVPSLPNNLINHVAFLFSMSSIDIEIGFMEEPEGLEAFLISEGFVPDAKDRTQYAHEEFDYPWIFYNPKVTPFDRGEPNWRKAGFKVVSGMNLVTKDFDHYELIGEIADKITKRFNAVQYDLNLEQFYTSDQL